LNNVYKLDKETSDYNQITLHFLQCIVQFQTRTMNQANRIEYAKKILAEQNKYK